MRGKLAKSVMEHEEGLNYLWVRIEPLEASGPLRLYVKLPEGVRRRTIRTGFDETESGAIVIPAGRSQGGADVYVELYTVEPTECGDFDVIVTLAYTDSTGRACEIERRIPLRIMREEEIADPLVDEETAERIHRLEPMRTARAESDRFRFYSSKDLIRIDPNVLSEQEKKYRIDWRLG
ncbi:hypothetical protein [Paenibacillus flagellatus]|uniref:Uncharacterized protein n=1 Tax=Paenibacillus flagellatus TaxID=2211139 RepID=A0A2V5K2W1_9BACL|nr:hypothetical protein [Paenibacillus flagellatus]PYI51903.1 hypothetical protein DLM86_23610 [Paenibacillus flagellatus]